MGPEYGKYEFVEYMSLLENIYEAMRKETPAVSILCVDFNVRSPLFWEGDSENNEGVFVCLNNFLISNHLEQLINEPTRVRIDVSQSCIN